MVDEEISAWITKGYIYGHLAGCYMRYTGDMHHLL